MYIFIWTGPVCQLYVCSVCITQCNTFGQAGGVSCRYGMLSISITQCDVKYTSDEIHLDRPGVSVVGMLWCQMLPWMLNLFALFSQILYEVCTIKTQQQQNKTTIIKQQRNNNDDTATLTEKCKDDVLYYAVFLITLYAPLNTVQTPVTTYQFIILPTEIFFTAQTQNLLQSKHRHSMLWIQLSV